MAICGEGLAVTLTLRHTKRLFGEVNNHIINFLNGITVVPRRSTDDAFGKGNKPQIRKLCVNRPRDSLPDGDFQIPFQGLDNCAVALLGTAAVCWCRWTPTKV